MNTIKNFKILECVKITQCNGEMVDSCGVLVYKTLPKNIFRFKILIEIESEESEDVNNMPNMPMFKNIFIDLDEDELKHSSLFNKREIIKSKLNLMGYKF